MRRAKPPRSINANSSLDQSVGSQIRALQNNEIDTGYQPNLHSLQGDLTTPKAHRRRMIAGKRSARREAGRLLPSRLKTARYRQ